jgi:hypothetical protein
MTKRIESGCGTDCYECFHACVAYPTMDHSAGEPFCVDGRQTTTHNRVELSLHPGDMSPVQPPRGTLAVWNEHRMRGRSPGSVNPNSNKQRRASKELCMIADRRAACHLPPDP